MKTRAREQKNLTLKKPRTESLQKTVYYRAGLAWNTVPSDLRVCTSKLQFKKTFISRDLCSRLPEIVLYH